MDGDRERIQRVAPLETVEGALLDTRPWQGRILVLSLLRELFTPLTGFFRRDR